MISVLHRTAGCGEVAFKLKERVREGQVIAWQNVVFDDGTQPKLNDVITCQHCSRPVYVVDIIWAEEPHPFDKR